MNLYQVSLCYSDRRLTPCLCFCFKAIQIHLGTYEYHLLLTGTNLICQSTRYFRLSPRLIQYDNIDTNVYIPLLTSFKERYHFKFSFKEMDSKSRIESIKKNVM